MLNYPKERLKVKKYPDRKKNKIHKEEGPAASMRLEILYYKKLKYENYLMFKVRHNRIQNMLMV